MGQNPPNLGRNIHQVAASQGGHITRQQLFQAGMTSSTLERWIANGHLIRTFRGVYAVGHLPTNPIDRAHAALLATGPRSALSHRSALAIWAFRRSWPPRPEVILPVDRRPAGIKIHRSATLLRRDVAIVQGLRVTSAARTALDYAETATPKQLHAAVDHLRLRHGMTLEQLRDIAARNTFHPGTQLLLKLIGAVGSPTRSGFERLWPAFARRFDLPAYEQNARVAGYEVDILVAGAVIVELDTVGTHRLNFESDRERDATILAATGIPTIRVTWDQFRHAPDAVANRLRSAVNHRRRGD